MSDFTELVNLLGERLGGAALATNDDFFAAKENLVRDAEPEWREHDYTDRGKWMDGWESRRRRTPGHDWCVVRLGAPGVVRGLDVYTRYFRGNYPEACQVEGCVLPPEADEAAFAAAPWFELLPRSLLKGDSHNLFEVAHPTLVTHLRLNIFPDGGVARLRVYGQPLADLRRLGGGAQELDLGAIENGGLAVTCSDMFFGVRHNLLMPGRAKNMSDGWETRRRRGPGYDWALIRLAGEGTLSRLELDTNHFKGNYPDTAQVEVSNAPLHVEPRVLAEDASAFTTVLPRTKLQAHTRHVYTQLAPHPPARWVKLSVYPDGGVSRLRLWGRLTEGGREALGLERLNRLPHAAAVAELLQCCGASAWAEAMAAARPFPSRLALEERAVTTWRALGADAHLEAFRAHPRIGGQRAQHAQTAVASAWSGAEQAGVQAADEAARAKLGQLNDAYFAKFGFIFIICATGKSANELLAALEARLGHGVDEERAVAAAEQERITALRLGKWLTP